MIKLKKIEYRNFMSYGNKVFTLDLDTISSVLIHGKNGHGKSIIVEAIHYLIQGSPYRDITLAELINKTNKKQMWVHGVFEDDNGNIIDIERGLKPDVNIIKKNGEPIREKISKEEFQNFLDDFIGIPKKIFNQTVIIDRAFFKPFLELKSQERRAIVDDVFDLSIITDMQTRMKEYNKKAAEQQEKDENELKLLQQRVVMMKEHSKDKKEKEILTLEENIKVWKNKIQENEVLCADISTSLIELGKQKEKIELDAGILQTHLADYERQMVEINALVDKGNKKVRYFDNEKEIKKDSAELLTFQRAKSELEDKLSEEETSLKTIQTEASDLRVRYTELKSELATIQSRISLLAEGKCDKCGSVFGQAGESERKNLESDLGTKNGEMELIKQKGLDCKTKQEKCEEKIKGLKTEIKSKVIICGEIEKHIEGRTSTNTEIIQTYPDIKDFVLMADELALRKTTLTQNITETKASFKQMQEMLTAKRNEISLVEQSQSANKSQSSTYLSECTKAEAKIKSIRDDEKDDVELLKAEKELLEQEKKCRMNDTMVERTNSCVDILSEKEIKPYIIKKSLREFNRLLAKYLELLDSNFSFTLDTQMEQVVDERLRGQNITYGGFSAGQKSRVNLAIFFSILEFKEKHAPGHTFNFILIDEALENFNLDTDGKQQVLQILKTSINKKLILISHDGNIKNYFDNAIGIELVGNYSQVVGE